MTEDTRRRLEAAWQRMQSANITAKQAAQEQRVTATHLSEYLNSRHWPDYCRWKWRRQCGKSQTA